MKRKVYGGKLLISLGLSLIAGISGLAQNKTVSGQWLEAEDYPSAPIKFANDKNVGGGMVTWGSRWYRLARVPLPENKQPAYVYIYAKTTDNQQQYFSLRCGKKSFGKVHLPSAGKWCWAKLGPVKYSGQDFSITPNGAAGINSYLDGFVLSQDAGLTETQLDKMREAEYNGQVAIGKTAPPVIDGRLDDKCWRNAVTITPFLIGRQNVFAKEQTKAYLAYDDKNIYVGAKCYARVLDPAQNRLHEFVDKVKEKDSKSIFNDDCFVVLFAPDKGKMYEITVNANGAVADAKCTGPDYWGARDLSWNSGAEAAGSRENGFWSVEIAVPRTALGGNSVADLKFLVGRINQAMHETSAFSVMKSGFHDSSSLSTLLFKSSVPAVGLDGVPAFSAGKNTLPIDIGGTGRGNLLIEQFVKSGSKTPVMFVHSANLSEKAIVEAPLEIPGGRSSYRVVLRDGATCDLLLGTPQYSFNPAVTELRSEMKSSGEFKLFVNGKSDGGKLNKGVNVLAVKAGQGASGRIVISDSSFALDSSWKFSASEAKDWTTQNFTAANWQPAPFKDGVLQQSGYLRKVIIIDETELWPNWQQNGVSICRGSLQQFFFPPRGLKDIGDAVDFKMNVELPEGFELCGASSYYKLFKVSVSKTGTVIRNGQKYVKYQLSLPQNRKYLQKLPRSHEYCVFAVSAPREFNAEANMYYYASTDGAYVEEVPQKLKINLLPELKPGRPEKIIFQLWTGWLKCMTDTELQRKVAEACKTAGFNEMQRLDVKTPGVRQMDLINFKSWNLNFAPFVQQHPDMALVDAVGRKQADLACPTALLNDPAGKQYMEKVVAEWLKARQVKHVDWDYEHSPFDSYISCYCPRCMQAFGHGQLSAAEVKRKYAGAWIDFMTGRMADIAGRIREALRKIDQDVVFSVYSGYQCDRTMQIYGVDWSKLNGRIDIAMCGYGRSQELLDATYKAVGRTELILGAIARPYLNTNRSFPTECSAAMLMRRLLDGRGGGVLVYYLPNLDGRTFSAVSTVSGLAAEYEDFFRQGKRIDGSLKLNGEYAVLQHAGKKLLVLLNQGSKPCKYTVNAEIVTLQPGEVKTVIIK